MSSARASVLRSLILFAPFFAVAAGVLAFIVSDVATDGLGAGQLIGLLVVGFVALLFGYQVVQSVRDLLTNPIETVGRVERQWSHNDLLIFKNTYVFVKGSVFRLTPEQALDVDLGDVVRVTHFPHTSTVDRIEVVTAGDEEEGGGDG